MNGPPAKGDAHELGGDVGIGREHENERTDCARGAVRMQGPCGIVAVAKALAAHGFLLRRTPIGMFICAMEKDRAR